MALPSGFSDFTNGFSVEAWANFTSNNGWETIVDLGNGNDINLIRFGRYYSNADIGLYTAESNWLWASGSIINNEWHHYAATIDASGNRKIYKDGVQIASGAGSVPANITRTKNYIGRSDYANNFLKAMLMKSLFITARFRRKKFTHIMSSNSSWPPARIIVSGRILWGRMGL